MDDDLETTGMALLVCASIGPGSLYILLPSYGTHFSPPPWTLKKKKKSFHDAHYELAPILNTLQVLTLYNPHINSIIISGLGEVYKAT